MAILLTGSSGWPGRTLAARLKRDGQRVVGLDVVQGEHTTVVGSIADRATIDRLMFATPITAVAHCGGLHKPA